MNQNRKIELDKRRHESLRPTPAFEGVFLVSDGTDRKMIVRHTGIVNAGDGMGDDSVGRCGTANVEYGPAPLSRVHDYMIELAKRHAEENSDAYVNYADRSDFGVGEFSDIMFHEMKANIHKGDAWTLCPIGDLLLEIYRHVAKLDLAIRNSNTEQVKEFSADVANLAMMTYQNRLVASTQSTPVTIPKIPVGEVGAVIGAARPFPEVPTALPPARVRSARTYGDDDRDDACSS